MTAPTSPVDICNLAMTLLGQKRVFNIDSPSSIEEQTCAQWYDLVRRALLREYIWRFAKGRAILSRSGAPEFDWSSAYTLPNDFLRLLSVNGDTELYQTSNYDLEEGALLLNSDSPTLKVRYVKDVPNVSRWDSLFTMLVTYSLALRVAYAFSLKKGLLEQINSIYTLEIAKAVTINSQENPPKRIQTSRYLHARGGSGFSGYFAGPIMDVDS